MDAVDRIETARLRLRRWHAGDEAPMLAINEDPEVTRYLNRRVDAAANAAFLARAQEHWAEHGFGFWAIETRPSAEGPAELVGFAGVAYPTFIAQLASRPELGWRLARGAWGRGLATEAASAARDHAFATLALPELISIIHPENARSLRLASRLGMVAEGQVHNPIIARDVDVWRLAAPDGG
jgi:RimJ/RimL family protein N-acetyltransferase